MPTVPISHRSPEERDTLDALRSLDDLANSVVNRLIHDDLVDLDDVSTFLRRNR